jgi:two-component system sensor histidine kinase/response regulator
LSSMNNEANLKFLKDYAKGFSLLYVEDDPEIRSELQEMFANFFDKIWVAENGEEGLTLFLEKAPDIVITDILMPKMSGIQLVEEILKLNPDQNISVISAHSDADKLIELINLGVYFFILKPVAFGDLIRTLSKQLLALLGYKESQYQYKQLKEGLKEKKAQLEVAEGKIIELYKARESLVGLLSHELRTPLNGLQGFFDLIRPKIDHDQQIAEHFDLMEKSFQRLEKVANKAIRLTQLTTMQDPGQWIEFDLGDFFADYIQTHSMAGDIKLINQETITVHTDPNLLMEVIDNLVENARKYTHNTAIEISYGWEDLHIFIGFRDHGKGIPEKAMEELSVPFKTKRVNTHQEGLGMGLSISKTIMRILDGELVLSNHPEGGLFVSLKLYPFDMDETN